MTVCCPLSGCDDYATVWKSTKPKARKSHRCEECSEEIPAGSIYEHISVLFEGEWDTFKVCLLCSEISTHFACNGRVIGSLWEDLEQNFFPDMKMGGPCMEGLSPKAKLALVEDRMAWYLDQDEIDDSAWEDWPKHRDRQRPLRTAPADEPHKTVLFGDWP